MKTLLSVLLAATALPSCQLVPSEFVSVEARAIVVDDAEGRLSNLTEDDVELTGYGAHLAVMTSVVDVVGGIDQREFEDSDTPELNVGLRKRLFDVAIVQGYVEGVLRYGFDLDTQDVSEDYFGYSAGFGALIDLGESLFLNARVMYDSTSIDVGPEDVDVDGLIGTIGIGLRF
ncbi:MAG: hypothetical protein AAFU73_16960 [Planctomycetota bacterium]